MQYNGWQTTNRAKGGMLKNRPHARVINSRKVCNCPGEPSEGWDAAGEDYDDYTKFHSTRAAWKCKT